MTEQELIEYTQEAIIGMIPHIHDIDSLKKIVTAVNEARDKRQAETLADVTLEMHDDAITAENIDDYDDAGNRHDITFGRLSKPRD